PSYAEKGHDPHYYGIYDDKQRMMVLICFNNHFGDGWEHETDDHSYFDTFSEPQAYPFFQKLRFFGGGACHEYSFSPIKCAQATIVSRPSADQEKRRNKPGFWL